MHGEGHRHRGLHRAADRRAHCRPCAAGNFSERERQIAARVVGEIGSRLEFLTAVGLDYLSLDRSAATLSGGEAQRIRLATQIGSKLRGVLYVLDEPSIGLHPRDNDRLLDTLERLRDLGNTVLVVEHDAETIERADYVIDLGPGAGRLGGELVAAGTPARDRRATPTSLTGQYLSGACDRSLLHGARAPATARARHVHGATRTQSQERRRGVSARARSPWSRAFPEAANQRSSTTSCIARSRSTCMARTMSPARTIAIDGPREHRQGDRDRPVAHRPHAAVEPGYVHRRFHADPRPVRACCPNRANAAISQAASAST